MNSLNKTRRLLKLLLLQLQLLIAHTHTVKENNFKYNKRRRSVNGKFLGFFFISLLSLSLFLSFLQSPPYFLFYPSKTAKKKDNKWRDQWQTNKKIKPNRVTLFFFKQLRLTEENENRKRERAQKFDLCHVNKPFNLVGLSVVRTHHILLCLLIFFFMIFIHNSCLLLLCNFVV